MRIVAMADTHTFIEDLNEIPDGDVLIHAGDICRGGTLKELRPTVEWMAALPHRHKIIVAGNHDWCFIREREAACALFPENMTYLEDAPLEIEGMKFWGSPWQPAYNDWAFNLPRGRALAEKWALIPEDTDVLVTHGPPLGYGDKVAVAGRQGCAALLDAVDRVQPFLHLFGHIHHDGGSWTRGKTTFVNATTWECERAPSVVDIDSTGSVALVDIPAPK